MNIKLELALDEVNVILTALGEMPAKTNAMFLIQKIKEQGEAQLPKESQEPQKE